MKNRIVIWGEDSNTEDKVLLALELKERENKVEIVVIPFAEATEDLYNSLMNKWKANENVKLPDNVTVISRELSVTKNILPDHLKTDKSDILNRAQAEWHFNVLSAKLYEMYKSELDELKDKIESLNEYSEEIWNEMKAFWEKVSTQVRERNMFRDHASTLKERTNTLFDKLKTLRKEMKKQLEITSSEITFKYNEEIVELEKKVEEGLALAPIFNELKTLQSRFFKENLVKKDKDSLWNKIDTLFKRIKEKKFGDNGNTNKSGSRLKSRYDGLLKAINRMQNSIVRDKKDIDFQNKKINSTDGQLEAQIRQAKLVMIQQKIDSKQAKLDDMLKTKIELEKALEKEKQRAKQLQLNKEKEKAKEEVKKKIKAEISSNMEDLKENEENLKKAAREIKASSKKSASKVKVEQLKEEQNTEKEARKSEASDLKEKISNVAASFLDEIEETVENVSEKVSEAIDDLSDKFEELNDSLKE